MKTNKEFPNGLTSFLETHFEVSAAIGSALSMPEIPERLDNILKEQGTGGIYELAEDLTLKFETQNKDVQWGFISENGKFFDYFETIEEFLRNELESEN